MTGPLTPLPVRICLKMKSPPFLKFFGRQVSQAEGRQVEMLRFPIKGSITAVPRAPTTRFVSPFDQRRGFFQLMAGGAGGGGGKILFVAAFLLGGFAIQTFLRSSWNQQRSLRNAFKRNLSPPLEGSRLPSLERHAEAEILRKYFEADAGGFFAITGAYGSGKDFLLQEALKNRPNVVHFDVRQTPVTTPDEFMYHLLKSLGYRLPYFERMVRGLLRERGPKRLVESLEMDRFVKDFTFFLRNEKKKRRENKGFIPVLLVTGLEGLSPEPPPKKEKDKDKDGDKKKEDKNKAQPVVEGPDPGLAKFFDLCVLCVDHGLAIVALSTTRQFLHSQIDSDYRLRLKREVFDISYPTVNEVQQYLNKTVYQYLHDRPEGFEVQASELSRAVSVVGPNLAHIQSLISAMARGVSPGIAAVRLHRDAAMHITTHLEGLLAEPSRFQAVWELFTELVQHPVPRHETIGELFGENLQDFYALERNCIIRVSYNRFPPAQGFSENTIGLRDDLEDAWVEPYSALEHAAMKSVLEDTMLSSYAEKTHRKLKVKKLKKELSEQLEDLNVLEDLIGSQHGGTEAYTEMRDHRLKELYLVEQELKDLEQIKHQKKQEKLELRAKSTLQVAQVTALSHYEALLDGS
jgi:hypothetical protein